MADYSPDVRKVLVEELRLPRDANDGAILGAIVALARRARQVDQLTDALAAAAALSPRREGARA